MELIFDFLFWPVLAILIVLSIILSYQCVTMTPEEFWSSYTVYGKKKLDKKSDTDKDNSNS